MTPCWHFCDAKAYVSFDPVSYSCRIIVMESTQCCQAGSCKYPLSVLLNDATVLSLTRNIKNVRDGEWLRISGFLRAKNRYSACRQGLFIYIMMLCRERVRPLQVTYCTIVILDDRFKIEQSWMQSWMQKKTVARAAHKTEQIPITITNPATGKKYSNQTIQ